MIDQLELPLLGQEEDAIEITYAAVDMFLALAEETG